MINEVIKAIKEAGKIVQEGYHTTKEIRHKGAIDLVTEYDVKTEEYLKTHLPNVMPEHTIIAEETNNLEDKSAKNQIIIDPIDGTTNFVQQIPFVAISVGVYTDGKPDFGIVYNPILDELYHAKVSQGAYLNGTPIHVSTKDELKRSILATGFPYSITEDKSDFELTMSFMSNALQNVTGVRRLGAAALDLCMLARGSVDVYYEMNLKAWDVSAGIIILQEAGGKVSNKDGNPYTLYEDKYIVASNSTLHSQLLDILP
jgi:myo-inositol-1(or 4)-monophosphatase